jgi:hypothetical protein
VRLLLLLRNTSTSLFSTSSAALASGICCDRDPPEHLRTARRKRRTMSNPEGVKILERGDLMVLLF